MFAICIGCLRAGSECIYTDRSRQARVHPDKDSPYRSSRIPFSGNLRIREEGQLDDPRAPDASGGVVSRRLLPYAENFKLKT